MIIGIYYLKNKNEKALNILKNLKNNQQNEHICNLVSVSLENWAKIFHKS